jgi:hypothetical protein
MQKKIDFAGGKFFYSVIKVRKKTILVIFFSFLIFIKTCTICTRFGLVTTNWTLNHIVLKKNWIDFDFLRSYRTIIKVLWNKWIKIEVLWYAPLASNKAMRLKLFNHLQNQKPFLWKCKNFWFCRWTFL